MSNHDRYVHFVEKRYEAWVNRMLGKDHPWTDDPIINTTRFANVFRILDPGTQFLVRELQHRDDPSDHDVLMRCFLYRYTNRPEPWQAFRDQYGRYPLAKDLQTGNLADFWQAYKAEGGPIFGAGFRMFVGAENKGVDRLTWILDLASNWFATSDLADSFYLQGSAEQQLNLLKVIPRCKDFMAMQILTDVGYWTGYDENEFIVPGSGAVTGASLARPGEDPVEIIEWYRLFWEGSEIELPWVNRNPSLMDVQGTLSEFARYNRLLSGKRTSKMPYKWSGSPLLDPVYPPHWRGEE